MSHPDIGAYPRRCILEPAVSVQNLAAGAASDGTGAPAMSVARPAADGLACPDCGAPLRECRDDIECITCDRRWPVVDGIPQFIGDFPYWGEIPLTEMQAVNCEAERGSWQKPLLSSQDPRVQQAAQMILNLERANWQYLIDLPPESRALDIGAGMGTNSHALASRCREVVALEPVLERTRFMRHRFGQENLSNVKIVRSSVWTLPFPPESFDLVAMNGVLEWVPEGQTEEPAVLQRRALMNAFRLLRPGGRLYVGIENRMKPGYFIGHRDPHCGLPFVTVLPRPLAHWYARRKGLPGYRNYLYSARGYRKLFESAGFDRLVQYVALPSYNHPRFFIPLGKNIFSYYSRNFNPAQGSRVRRLLHKALLEVGLVQYCEYSFAIIAQKP
jgi:ubiquinone/menaquinone biosynthesis C-methylase UbiE